MEKGFAISRINQSVLNTSSVLANGRASCTRLLFKLRKVTSPFCCGPRTLLTVDELNDMPGQSMTMTDLLITRRVAADVI